MPNVHVNDLDLEYDTFGDPAAPPMLLVMGLGTQLTAWRPEFCKRLAARGFRVIRFDNRDVGLSTKLDDGPQPDLGAIMGGDPTSAPYLLKDMAADAVGLLDALGIGRAHVTGASMGGMIVQELLIRYADRVASACSIMSTTGNPTVGRPSHEAAGGLFAPPANSREEAIERSVAANRLISSPAYPKSDEELRALATESYDRAYCPAGKTRHLAAVMASGDRTEALKSVSAPVLVIHGDADTLVHVSGGRATADAIPGAKLIEFPGMSHDLPVELWDDFFDAIVANAEKA